MESNVSIVENCFTVHRCCGDTREKSQRLLVSTPEYSAGYHKMTCWVLENDFKREDQPIKEFPVQTILGNNKNSKLSIAILL